MMSQSILLPGMVTSQGMLSTASYIRTLASRVASKSLKISVCVFFLAGFTFLSSPPTI